MKRRPPDGGGPRRGAIPLLLGIMLLTGCDLGPDYRAPLTGIPARWSGAPADASPAFPGADWWRAFRSPTLDRLVERARAANQTLAAAEANVRAADAAATIAGAPLLPALSFGTAVGPQRSLNRIGRERHYILYQGQFQASYEIDFWGKNRAALDAAQASAQASRLARDVVWLTVSSGVATLYLQSLGVQDRLRVAHDNAAGARHSLDDVAIELHQGTVPRVAFLQQQALTAEIEAAIPPLEQQLVATDDALAILVGDVPGTVPGPTGSLADLAAPAPTAGVPSRLLARRPDVREAEAELVAANADIRVARAELFPSFTLPLTGGLTSEALTGAFAGPLGTYSLLSSIAQPIFAGGALRAQVGLARARYQALLTGTYRQTVLTAFGDVEDALAAVRTTIAEMRAQSVAASVAQSSSSAARQSFAGGVGTVLSLLTSQTSEYAARDLLVQARLAYLESLVGLDKAVGGGWEQSG